MGQGGYSTNPTRSEQLLFLTDDQLRQGIELMFFAYRGFTADPDRILEERGVRPGAPPGDPLHQPPPGADGQRAARRSSA